MSNALPASSPDHSARDAHDTSTSQRRADTRAAAAQPEQSGNWWYAFDRWLAVSRQEEEFVMA